MEEESLHLVDLLNSDSLVWRLWLSWCKLTLSATWVKFGEYWATPLSQNRLALNDYHSQLIDTWCFNALTTQSCESAETKG
jgi:hypothetical protein